MSGVSTRADIPAEATQDPTDVVDLGLDLDYEQRPVGGTEREDVDPPPEPTLADLNISKSQSSTWQRLAALPEADLDLRPDLPPALRELSRDVAAAACVNQVALLPASDEPNRIRINGQPDPEQVESRRSEARIDGCAACLQAPNCRLVRVEPASELTLAPPKALRR